jgi:hypothetical protein
MRGKAPAATWISCAARGSNFGFDVDHHGRFARTPARGPEQRLGVSHGRVDTDFVSVG